MCEWFLSRRYKKGNSIPSTYIQYLSSLFLSLQFIPFSISTYLFFFLPLLHKKNWTVSFFFPFLKTRLLLKNHFGKEMLGFLWGGSRNTCTVKLSSGGLDEVPWTFTVSGFNQSLHWSRIAFGIRVDWGGLARAPCIFEGITWAKTPKPLGRALKRGHREGRQGATTSWKTRGGE